MSFFVVVIRTFAAHVDNILKTAGNKEAQPHAHTSIEKKKKTFKKAEKTKCLHFSFSSLAEQQQPKRIGINARARPFACMH